MKKIVKYLMNARVAISLLLLGLFLYYAGNSLCKFYLPEYTVSGFIYLIISFMLLDFCIMLVYDITKTDWFGLEWLKVKEEKREEIREEEKNYISRKIIERKKTGKKYLLLIFFLFMSPVLTAIYYRNGHHIYNLFSNKKTVLFFFLSSLLCSIKFIPQLIIINYLWGFIKIYPMSSITVICATVCTLCMLCKMYKKNKECSKLTTKKTMVVEKLKEETLELEIVLKEN